MKRGEHSTTTETGHAGVTKRPRVGRPMMRDAPTSLKDEDAVRKERIRLAQRNYRLKREGELNAAREKAEKAESAIGKIIESFAKFHNEVTAFGDGGNLPPSVVMALSRTALEITNLSNEVRSTDDGSDDAGGGGWKWAQSEGVPGNELQEQASPRLNRSSTAPQFSSISYNTLDQSSNLEQGSPQIPPHHPYSLLPYTQAHSHLSFDLRLRLASLEKATRLLSTPTLSISEIHPVLSLHLKWLPVQQLLALNQESLFRFPNLKLYGPDPHPALPSPDLYRVVEGEDTMIERKFGRDVEILVKGKTRTKVCTDMPGFEGEWMEARDVMEYLEEKGVRFDLAAASHSFPPVPEPCVPPIVGEEEFIDPLLSTISGSFSSESSVEKGSLIVKVARPKFKGFLNLQVLIEHLGIKSCCIGPAPAMRKEDVDQALMLSITGL